MDTPMDIRLHIIRDPTEIPDFTDQDCIAGFFHSQMRPWNDTLADIQRGLDYAFSEAEGMGGFLVLAEQERALLGALLMLNTGMGGYVPAHLLLFVAVTPEQRGKRIGRALIERALSLVDGPVKLHVEYDNPAKRLYERMGFESKYAEMRYTP